MEGKAKEQKKLSFYQKHMKRVLDLILALFLLIILSPIMLIVYILVKIDELGSPAIFKQIRCGKDNKPFEMYKYRSMKSSAHHNMATSEFEDSDKYISKFGKFIRKTSIDELPQLMNIIKGEMSFIGPRPLIFEESDILEVRERLGVNQVLPGITGNAQISGRDAIEIEEKIKFDAEYSNNISLKFDIKLFFMTIPIVVFSKGNKDSEPVELTETAKIYKMPENRNNVPGLDLDVTNR